MLKLVSLLALLALFTIGCSNETRLTSVQRQVKSISAEDVIRIASGSISANSIAKETARHVGGQLLAIAYTRYQTAGCTSQDLERLPDSAFSENLRRLYADLGTVFEQPEKAK